MEQNNLSNSSTGFPPLTSLSDLYSIHRPSIMIIDRYVTPIWYVIGFPGNVLSLTVWIQPRMRPSSGCYLAALATADFIFLVLHLFFELQSAWNVTILSYPVLCEAFPVFFLASQYLSPLLVLGFTVERYVSVCHPFQRERFCNPRRTVGIIVGLSSFSLSLHLVQAYFWRYDPGAVDCDVRPEVSGTANDDSWALWTVWSWITELIVFGIVPLAILVLNLRVIGEARKLSANEDKLLCRQVRRKNKGTATSSSSSSSHHRTSAPSATTVTLLAVSFYLIVTTLPATVAYAIYYSFPVGSFDLTQQQIAADAQWQRHFRYWKVRTIIQEVCMSHYAGNFWIYVLTGRIFRKELFRLLNHWTRLCRRTSKDHSWNGEFSYTKAEASYNVNGVTTV